MFKFGSLYQQKYVQSCLSQEEPDFYRKKNNKAIKEKNFNIMKTTARNQRMMLACIMILLLSLWAPVQMQAQSFGRNKPSYKVFDYKIYQSPHFEFYHYMENDSVINAVANMFEKWYLRHQKAFLDTIKKPNPIIIYENHPDFQQTTAISGEISIGTQGVTEALKNRIVLPILETNSQTDHVIGHELVHVFQFRVIFNNDSLSLRNLENLPLWMVEGMAEYMSIGNIDSHTAMIMRDAIYYDDFPSLKDMSRSNKYNPYRYGHAFLSFIANSVGDSVVQPMFLETAKYGYERAFEKLFGLNEKNISELWKKNWKEHLETYLNDSTKQEVIGKMLISDKNAGEMNISPSYSPDGKYFTFFSEKNLFSIDLYLAESKSGKILRKLSSSTRNQDIDGYNFFESVGTWSPDGSRFAHVAIKKGKSILVIVNPKKPRKTKEIFIPGIASFNNPNWSPDGTSIVVSGLVNGRNDLFVYNLNDKSVKRLTNDRYSYIHPQWSPDGKYLTFATDLKQPSDTSALLNYHFNIGIMDMTDPNHPVEIIEVFNGAENVNPQFSPDGKSLYFLSDRDGFRNLYKYNLSQKKVFQLTNYYTGISGITHLSPAISIARHDSSIVYSYYKKGKYQIYKAGLNEFSPVETDPQSLDFSAATLVPLKPKANIFITESININNPGDSIPSEAIKIKKYKPRLGLTYIGNSGIGISTSQWGTGMAGGINMMFSDMTGDHQIISTIAVNGEIYDIGAMGGYINQKNKIKWGGYLSHIPYVYTRYAYGVDPTSQMLVLQYLIYRQFEDNLSAFAYYPFSSSRRLEVGGSISWYYYHLEEILNYYDALGYIVNQDRNKLSPPPGFNLQRINIAYVGDNSQFGMASPMTGNRYRLQVEQVFGKVNMTSVIADYRHYFYVKPFSFAFRLTHYGRYGKGADNDLFYPLYLGYMGYMRGYESDTYYRLINEDTNADININSLFGSKMLLGGIEIKLPFTGPKRLAVIGSKMFFTELTWFLDAGVAWYNDESITFNIKKDSETKHFPVFSTGPSLRINLFGAMIIEPYIAFPFQKEGLKNSVFGLNFLPGW